MSNAERQQRWRERRADGRRVFPVALDWQDLRDWLVDNDLLRADQVNDHHAMQRALQALLDDAFEPGCRRVTVHPPDRDT